MERKETTWAIKESNLDIYKYNDFFYGLGRMEENYKKIESLIEARETDSLIIERKYFPEIFDKSLIVLCGTSDGLPILERDFQVFLEIRGIIVKYQNSLGHFYYKKFEDEAGKYAIWNREVTEAYKKWAKGKKVYNRDKERISLNVEEETKKLWQEFIKKNNYSTISKLIRESVNHFIEKKAGFSQDLKESLIVIKNLNQLLREVLESEVSDEVRDITRKILDQNILLEERIMNILNNTQEES